MIIKQYITKTNDFEINADDSIGYPIWYLNRIKEYYDSDQNL